MAQLPRRAIEFLMKPRELNTLIKILRTEDQERLTRFAQNYLFPPFHPKEELLVTEGSQGPLDFSNGYLESPDNLTINDNDNTPQQQEQQEEMDLLQQQPTILRWLPNQRPDESQIYSYRLQVMLIYVANITCNHELMAFLGFEPNLPWDERLRVTKNHFQLLTRQAIQEHGENAYHPSTNDLQPSQHTLEMEQTDNLNGEFTSMFTFPNEHTSQLSTTTLNSSSSEDQQQPLESYQDWNPLLYDEVSRFPIAPSGVEVELIELGTCLKVIIEMDDVDLSSWIFNQKVFQYALYRRIISGDTTHGESLYPSFYAIGMGFFNSFSVIAKLGINHSILFNSLKRNEKILLRRNALIATQHCPPYHTNDRDYSDEIYFNDTSSSEWIQTVWPVICGERKHSQRDSNNLSNPTTSPNMLNTPKTTTLFVSPSKTLNYGIANHTFFDDWQYFPHGRDPIYMAIRFNQPLILRFLLSQSLRPVNLWYSRHGLVHLSFGEDNSNNNTHHNSPPTTLNSPYSQHPPTLDQHHDILNNNNNNLNHLNDLVLAIHLNNTHHQVHNDWEQMTTPHLSPNTSFTYTPSTHTPTSPSQSLTETDPRFDDPHPFKAIQTFQNLNNTDQLNNNNNNNNNNNTNNTTTNNNNHSFLSPPPPPTTQPHNKLSILNYAIKHCTPYHSIAYREVMEIILSLPGTEQLLDKQSYIPGCNNPFQLSIECGRSIALDVLWDKIAKSILDEHKRGLMTLNNRCYKLSQLPSIFHLSGITPSLDPNIVPLITAHFRDSINIMLLQSYGNSLSQPDRILAKLLHIEAFLSKTLTPPQNNLSPNNPQYLHLVDPNVFSSNTQLKMSLPGRWMTQQINPIVTDLYNSLNHTGVNLTPILWASMYGDHDTLRVLCHPQRYTINTPDSPTLTNNTLDHYNKKNSPYQPIVGNLLTRYYPTFTQFSPFCSTPKGFTPLMLATTCGFPTHIQFNNEDLEPDHWFEQQYHPHHRGSDEYQLLHNNNHQLIHFSHPDFDEDFHNNKFDQFDDGYRDGYACMVVIMDAYIDSILRGVEDIEHYDLHPSQHHG